MVKPTLIGIPLSKVGDRLRNLSKSLEQHGMALKADTGVHINCTKDGETAISCVLEVYLYDAEEQFNAAKKKVDAREENGKEK